MVKGSLEGSLPGLSMVGGGSGCIMVPMAEGTMFICASESETVFHNPCKVEEAVVYLYKTKNENEIL